MEAFRKRQLQEQKNPQIRNHVLVIPKWSKLWCKSGGMRRAFTISRNLNTGNNAAGLFNNSRSRQSIADINQIQDRH